jgi:nucleotide-binding universal stress UspA family protein
MDIRKDHVPMYQTIYVPLDNSDHSNAAMEMTLALGEAYQAKLAGSHVYAAKLHDVRFKQMEFTLPDEYKEDTELEKQRRIHDALIARGLELISDCYLDVMGERAKEIGLSFEGKRMDGRNFEELVSDIEESAYDLVVMGALGQGAVKQSKAGSVCERVLRRTAVDTLVIRDLESVGLKGDGTIMVALDGSLWSWGGLKAACDIAEKTGRSMEIVAVHADDSTAQELLDAHVTLARRMVTERDIPVLANTLNGVPMETIANHVERANPWLLVVGRHGVDASADAPELGSVVEHVIRSATSNVLVVAQTGLPDEMTASDPVHSTL